MWLWVVISLVAGLSAVSASGASAAQHKPGPPPSIAEGHITADQQKHPCLTVADGRHPGGYVFLAPCTTKLNANQRWKIARFKAVIIVALAAHPGTCLGAVPKTVKVKGQAFHYAVTYNCGGQITIPEGLLIGHIGGIYNTILQAHGGRLLSAPNRPGSGRTTRWLHSSGSIPFTQVWLFPKFKPI